MSDLTRIKATNRPAVPLPTPPKLSQFVAGKVALKSEVEKMDEALQRWWEKVQVRLG